MSKNGATGGDGQTDPNNQDGNEEQFTVVEVDDKGKPIHQELQEEDANESDQEDSDDDTETEDEAEDERLGHDENDDEDATRAGETVDAKRERRRRENRAKRIRNRVAAAAKDRLIENQGRMLLNLQEQVAQLQGRTVQYDVNLLQSTIAQIEQQQSDAKAVLAKLSKAQDHEGIAEVVELQINLRDQHRQATERLQRAKAQSKPGKRGNGQGTQDTDGDGEAVPAAQTRRPAPDPDVVRRAQGWTAKHDWADSRTGDPEEVEIVRAIDHNLSREGWDPRSNDYWVELTSRVKRRLPHHFKTKPNGSATGGERQLSTDNGGGKKPAQGGPRMAASSQSGSRALGKNEVVVTPARKKAMQEAGMWDDPKKRNRMLAQYSKYDREQAN